MKIHNFSQANRPNESVPQHLRRFADLIEDNVKGGTIEDISFSPASTVRNDSQFEATVHYSDSDNALDEDMNRVKFIGKSPNNMLAIADVLSQSLEWIRNNPDQRIFDFIVKQGFDGGINEVAELDIYYDVETVRDEL